MDTIEQFLSKTGKFPPERIPVVAALLYSEGQGFANALQLEGIQESVLFERYPGIFDGEVVAIVQAARTAGIAHRCLLSCQFECLHEGLC